MKTPVLGLALLSFPLISTSAFAANIAVSNYAGNNSEINAVADGTWTFNGHVGTWDLTSSVATAGDGWRNLALGSGANGVEYAFNHDWSRTTGGSTANPWDGANPPPQYSNSITFSWTGNLGHHIVISQSNYNNGGGWNGGGGNSGSEFTVSWAGGGNGSYIDPGDDLDDGTVAGDQFTGGSIASGTTIRQPFPPLQSRNNSDDWAIYLPTGVTSVTVDYTWYNDGGGTYHELVNEWLSFDIVPEPSRALLLLIGFFPSLLWRKR